MFRSETFQEKMFRFETIQGKKCYEMKHFVEKNMPKEEKASNTNKNLPIDKKIRWCIMESQQREGVKEKQVGPVLKKDRTKKS